MARKEKKISKAEKNKGPDMVSEADKDTQIAKTRKENQDKKPKQDIPKAAIEDDDMKDTVKKKKISFAGLKKSIKDELEPDKGTTKETANKEKGKKKKSVFANIKNDIISELGKDDKASHERFKEGKIDMAYLKATIQETLKQKAEITEDEQRPHQERVATGIEGFDELIEGGFIRDSAVLICGGPGSGKSILGMQYLVNGIDKYGENGVYISFEEEPETLIGDMSRFDWQLREKIEKKQLAILFFSPEQVDRVISIGGGPVREIVESINAKRVVIDSITSFTLLYRTENEQRKALMSLFKTLRKWNCTTLLISEQTLNPDEHKSGIEEYQSEGVVFMYHTKKGDIRERSIEIFKMRSTSHSTKICPLNISLSGVTVYPDENVY